MRGTSKTVILPVTGEDRRYIHTFGANADFHADDIDRTLIEQARIFYVGGYLALPALQQSELAQLFALAHESGARTVLDIVVPAGMRDSMPLVLDEILPYTDFFMPNDEEAQALTGETDPGRQAQQFLNSGCGTAIITMGQHGTLLMDQLQRVEVPAFPVDVVDASGAGDAFAAGFIVGLLEGWSMLQTLRFASAIGASACTRLGCTPGVFTRAQADAYLESHASVPQGE
jgi:sugar/nucleoside kinase (ribokinase family)